MDSNQYIGNDGLWHITFTVSLPKLLVKNKLNFRIHHLELKGGENVRDPNLESSNYIFEINKSLLGRKVFFNAYFPCKEIANVKDFVFGLCDEGVRWHNLNEFSVIINNQYAPIKVEDFKDIEIIEEVEEEVEQSNEEKVESIEAISEESQPETQEIYIPEEVETPKVQKEIVENKTKPYESQASLQRKNSSKKFEKKKK